DINNDGLIDAVVNEGQLTCDGQKVPQCNDDGCTYNFYLHVAEGGYFMIANALGMQLYLASACDVVAAFAVRGGALW
ncbi:hypothetical protein AB9F39_39680, partial [Rhizobium leguminosarum]